MTPSLSRLTFNLLKSLSTIGLIAAAGFIVSCTPESHSPQRGIASEGGAPTASLNDVHIDDGVSTYGLQEMTQTISATHSEAAKSEILGGFLAATAEDVLNAKDLGEVIAANADRACVFLGHIHGKNHKHAVDYETSEQVGPLMTPGTGQLSHQRAVPISKHDIRKRFCDKVAGFEPQEQGLYSTRCLETGSIEVMPLHFTALECDNVGKNSEVETHKEASSGRVPLYPNYRNGSARPTTR